MKILMEGNMRRLFSSILFWLRDEAADYKMLLRTIPSPAVSLFVLSVVCANLMANKELVSHTYFALDCGFVFSWIMFLCMDVICRRWGARAAVKISFFALAVNLAVCACFALLARTPGMWGAYYSTGDSAVNDALNRTFGGSWYVVLGSALAFAVSSVSNALLNEKVGAVFGRYFSTRGFAVFALRSYISTAVSQFIDNLIFAAAVSKVFFGWTWTQVLVCSATGAVFELLCEVVFSGVGYRVVRSWEEENVGASYFEYRNHKKLRRA